MHFYKMTHESGVFKGCCTLRIFSDANDKRAFDMTEITYRLFPTSKDINIVRMCIKQDVVSKTWDESYHYWESITAREAQPIVTAWTQQGITLITAISKQKMSETKAAKQLWQVA